MKLSDATSKPKVLLVFSLHKKSFSERAMVRVLFILLWLQHPLMAQAASLQSSVSNTVPMSPPVAVAHVNRHFYLSRPDSPVLIARLSAGFSSDQDGEIIDYQWRVDGSTYRGVEIDIVSFSEPAAQTQVQVELTVQDNDGQRHTVKTTLWIANRYDGQHQ
jgi:hypothetical protein